MKKEVCIGRTEFKLLDFEHEQSKILYELMSRQEVDNIQVDCQYFEGKPHDYDGVKDISFMLEIKVLSKHPNEPLHWYEVYSNGNDSTYDHINCFLDEDEQPLPGGTKEAEKFEETVRLIYEGFDEYTVNFLKCTLQNIERPKIYTGAPQFIKKAINDVRQSQNTYGI